MRGNTPPHADTAILAFQTIPTALQQRPQWVLWKLENREGKNTKVPYTVEGARASSTNQRTWSSFEKVLACFRNGVHDGIGFVLTKADPYVGIDLDWKKYKSEGVPDEARALLEHLDSYSEFSPSGKGCHIFVTADVPSGRKKQLTHTCDIEVYPQGRFLTMTGLHLDFTPDTIEDRANRLKSLYTKLFNDKAQSVQKPVKRQPLSLSDSEIIRRAKAAKNGAAFTALWEGNTTSYSSHSEADLALCTHLNFWTSGNAETIDRLFRQSALYREKWDKRHYGDGKTYGQATVEKALISAVIEARACKGNFRQRLHQRLRAL
jgi:putative DNA primase/helicase